VKKNINIQVHYNILLHSSSQLSPLEQVLLEPAIEKILVFLAKLEAVAFVAVMFSDCLVLELVAFALVTLSTSLFLSYSPSNFYPMLLTCHTIV